MSLLCLHGNLIHKYTQAVKKSGMLCAGGLIGIIIYFKIQSHFQSGYFHSSSAVTAHNFGLQRQVNKKWSIGLLNYEETVVEQSRHLRAQKTCNFKGCKLGTLFFKTVAVCCASCIWFKMFTLSKPRVQYSWAINRTAARVSGAAGGWPVHRVDMFVCMCLLLLYLDLSRQGLLLPLGEEVPNLTGRYKFRSGSRRSTHFVVVVHCRSYSGLNLHPTMPAELQFIIDVSSRVLNVLSCNLTESHQEIMKKCR